MSKNDIDTSIFKGYDIRGIYPEAIDEDLAYKIAQGYVDFVQPKGEIMVGYDVRLQSENLKNHVIQGLTDTGVDVVDVGLISTDMYYFAVGNHDLAGGIQVTASHNPPEWHGMKMVREKVIPLTLEHGVGQIRDHILSGKPKIEAKNKGKVRKLDILDDYCNYILKFIDPKKVKKLKVVYNPNFGYAGKVFERVVELGNLPIDLIPLNAEPDGSFPKGRPDPFVPENRPEFLDLVKSSNADLGIAWDADADRVFFADDKATFLDPYYSNTVLIKSMLDKFPGEKIIYDPRYTWALIDTIEDNGGTPVLVRVGHSYIKEEMRKENALFATESSGHTYYRDFWYADCGMIPALQIIEFLSLNERPLSEIMTNVMKKYPISGEINTKVDDVNKKIEEISQKYSDAEQSLLDGISIEYEDFRFNVRPSNTEPLLRLNLEAKTEAIVKEKTEEVLELIRN